MKSRPQLQPNSSASSQAKWPLPGRRSFLASLAAATAACRLDRTPSSAPSNTGAPSTADTQPALTTGKVPSVPGLSPQTIAEAEKLLALEYSEQERQSIIAAVESELARIQTRRKVPLSNALAPATVFDPRPTGFVMPSGPGHFISAPDSGHTLPAKDEDIAFAPVHQLSQWIKKRQLSCERLTQIYLKRLHQFSPSLECLVFAFDEAALSKAKELDQELAAGKYRGPLHGIPWGAKDLLETAGTPTTWGAMPYHKNTGQKDAEVVKRLDKAGAILLAKLSLGALAYGDVWYGGVTRNPWNLHEGSSGSSAGSAAATAAGLVGFALGTETYGSIVSPSMRCGTTGLRPTFGRVPRTGGMNLCWSLDKIGPITRSVEDTALVLHAITGPDGQDIGCIDAPFGFDAQTPMNFSGVKVGYLPELEDESRSHANDRKVLAELKKLGVQLRAIEVPDFPYESLLTVLLAEAAAAFEELTLSNDDDSLRWQEDDAWPNTFRAAHFISATDFIQTQRLRRKLVEEFNRMFAPVDMIVGPSFGNALLLATNYTGHPSLTFRSGFEQRKAIPTWGIQTTTQEFNAPYGTTLWGRLFEEGKLCRVGIELEKRLGVAAIRPKLSA